MQRFDIAIIGAGSGAETLVRELSGGDLTVVVFEPDLVGGECPFRACMPSKSMLHDARIGTEWGAAVARRREITNDLDDSGHAEDLRARGAELVRHRAEVIDAHSVEADGRRYEVDHIVLATGATPLMPPIEGSDECADSIWTSADALTSPVLPTKMVIVGAGVIGMECASLYGRYGAEITLIDSAERSFPDAPPEVSEIISSSLRERGVDIRYGVEASSIRFADDSSGDVVVTLSDDSDTTAERVLVAIGRRPNTTGLGLDRLGLDPEQPLPLAPNGRVRVDGSVWAIGDVAGQGQYTHLANHHATVVADHLAGTATRTFDDVVVPRCMFTEPPLIQVGPGWNELSGEPDVVDVAFDLATFPRATTDQLPPGHLWVAARRSTGCLVAATGAGPGFDELTHALVAAIDGNVPVARLRQSMRAFPTIGEILGPIYDDVHAELSGAG